MARTREDMEYAYLLDKLRAEFKARYKRKREYKVKLSDFERHRTLGSGSFGRVVICECIKITAYVLIYTVVDVSQM